MHPFLRSSALVVVVVAASACSSATTPSDDAGAAPSTPGNTTTSGKSPCLLLTRADAEAAVGAPLSKNVERKELGSRQSTTANFAAGASLTVSSWDAVKKAEASQNEKPLAVSGVGDEAYSNGPDLFFVRHGAEGFLLMLHRPGIDMEIPRFRGHSV